MLPEEKNVHVVNAFMILFLSMSLIFISLRTLNRAFNKNNEQLIINELTIDN